MLHTSQTQRIRGPSQRRPGYPAFDNVQHKDYRYRPQHTGGTWEHTGVALQKCRVSWCLVGEYRRVSEVILYSLLELGFKSVLWKSKPGKYALELLDAKGSNVALRTTRKLRVLQ
jgi:hypothetical protein